MHLQYTRKINQSNKVSKVSNNMLIHNRLFINVIVVLCLACYEFAECLFVLPEDLVSIINYAYKDLPPTNKGIDSRLGFGYRLGEHADLQVIFELGPQFRTAPLKTYSEEDTFGRRKTRKRFSKSVKTGQTPKSWLENWVKEIKLTQNERILQDDRSILPKNPQVPEKSLRQLQILHRMSGSVPSVIIPSNNSSSISKDTDSEKLSVSDNATSKEEKDLRSHQLS